MKSNLLKYAQKTRAVSEATSHGEKIYISGGIILLVSAAVWIFLEKESAITALIGLVVFSGGLVFEAIHLMARAWENKYLKVALSLLAAALSTLTLSISANIVANIVGAPPSAFPYTTAIVSILTIPLNIWLALMAIAILSMVGLIVGLPFLWVHRQATSSPLVRYAFRLNKKPRKERYFWIMMTVRVMAIGFLFGTMEIWVKFDPTYSNFVTQKASAYLYNFELYKNSYCTKTEENQRFGYISSQLAIVGSIDDAGKYEFVTRQCILSN